MQQSGGLLLAAGLDGGNTLISSDPSSSALKKALASVSAAVFAEIGKNYGQLKILTGRHSYGQQIAEST